MKKFQKLMASMSFNDWITCLTTCGGLGLLITVCSVFTHQLPATKITGWAVLLFLFVFGSGALLMGLGALVQSSGRASKFMNVGALCLVGLFCLETAVGQVLKNAFDYELPAFTAWYALPLLGVFGVGILDYVGLIVWKIYNRFK